MNKKKIAYYRLHITTRQFDEWYSLIQRNTPVTPEIVGYLLGRAVPIWEESNEDQTKEEE